MKKTDEELKKDAQRLVEQFGIEKDAKIDESLKLSQRKKNTEGTKSHIQDMKIKIWT